MTLAEKSSNRFNSILPNQTVRDILFLLIVISLSRILFVFQIGFYSDDWSFLEMLFFDKINIWDNYRPGYLITWKFLYAFFGFSPEGYHFVNTFIFYFNAILLYLILKKLRLPHIFVISIPLLFILLPHYSTFHFWPSVIPNHFCLVMCLGSLLLDLKSLESPFPKFLIWKFISVIAIIVSVLTYELFLAFFYFNLIVTYYYFRKLKSDPIEKKEISKKKLIWLLLVNFISLKIALVYKMFFTVTSVRMMGSDTSFFDHLSGLLANTFRLDYGDYDYGFNIVQSFKTNFIEYGIELPTKLIHIYNNYPSLPIFFIGLFLTLLIFGYLFFIVKKYDFVIFKLKSFVIMILLGLIIFFWGYSIFLTNYSIAFSTTGVANRVTIGVAIGIAIIYIGLITSISTLIKNIKFRNIFFSSLVTFTCVSGFIITNTIADFWKDAYIFQNETMVEIKNKLPELPENTNLIIDGICPYNGPAIIFECSWDMGGALRIAYSDTTIQGDVVAPDLQVTDEGIVTSIYETDYFYPYNILIYNFNEKDVFNISNKDEAIEYFESVNSNFYNNCSESHETHGEKIF